MLKIVFNEYGEIMTIGWRVKEGELFLVIESLSCSPISARNPLHITSNVTEHDLLIINLIIKGMCALYHDVGSRRNDFHLWNMNGFVLDANGVFDL